MSEPIDKRCKYWPLYRDSVQKFIDGSARLAWCTNESHLLVEGRFQVVGWHDDGTHPFVVSGWRETKGPIIRLTVPGSMSVFAPPAEATEVYNKLVAAVPAKEQLV